MKIGFIGQMRSGKDTAADYLRDMHQGHIMKFADPIYEIQNFAQEITGFPKEKDRHFLQWIGTEWGRAKDPDIWVKVLERRLDAMGNDCEVYITDVRFPNEITMLKKKGFTIVMIYADDEIRVARGATRETHISEAYSRTCEDYDFRIENNGTKEEFYHKLEGLLKELAA
jgi:dephospho-CoA kinase